MKGLPLAYQKDMQEDKQGAMEAFAALSLAIRAMTGMVARPRAGRSADEGRRRRGLCHRHRSCRLAGADAENAVPRRPSRHRAHRRRWPSKQGVALHELPLKAMQEVEPKITAEALARAVGGSLGQEPDQLWRHRAEERAGAGQSLAEAAGKRAKIGLSAKISLQFHGYPGSRQSSGNLCMVRPRIGDFVVTQ